MLYISGGKLEAQKLETASPAVENNSFVNSFVDTMH